MNSLTQRMNGQAMMVQAVFHAHGLEGRVVGGYRNRRGQLEYYWQPREPPALPDKVNLAAITHELEERLDLIAWGTNDGQIHVAVTEDSHPPQITGG